MATYEGDFVVLSIQVGQQILNAVSAKMMKGKKTNPGTPLLQYIYDFDPMAPRKPPARDQVMDKLKDPQWLLEALKARANYLHYNGAKVLQEVIAETGKMDASALDKVKIELTEMTWAHGYVLHAVFFLQRLKDIETKFPHLVPVLTPLFELFVLTIMGPSYDRGGGFGDFVAAGVLPGSSKEIVLKRTKELLQTIRPLAVPLVDAWNIPDFVINSCLGRYDGRYIDALYDQTSYEPLNKTDVTEGYYKHLQYIVHPERTSVAKAKL
jgi:acyl-CoA oxidase